MGKPLRKPRRKEYNIKMNLKRVHFKDERREAFALHDESASQYHVAFSSLQARNSLI
jgi:hypothetical protein